MIDATIVIPVKTEPYLPQLLSDICRSGEYREIRIQTELGLSNAVLKGISLAQGKYVCVMDGDGSHPTSAIPQMLNLLDNGYDIVLGSRYVEGGSSQDSLERKSVSLLYRYIAKTLFHLPVKDVMSGYVVAKKELYNELKVDPLAYKFGLALLIHNRGCKIYEYPIHFSKRKLGSSKADFRQGIQTLWFMLKLFAENPHGRNL